MADQDQVMGMEFTVQERIVVLCRENPGVTGAIPAQADVSGVLPPDTMASASSRLFDFPLHEPELPSPSAIAANMASYLNSPTDIPHAGIIRRSATATSSLQLDPPPTLNPGASLDWLSRQGSFRFRPPGGNELLVSEPSNHARTSPQVHACPLPLSINRALSSLDPASTVSSSGYHHEEVSSPFPSSSPSRLFTSSPSRDDHEVDDDSFVSSPPRHQKTSTSVESENALPGPQTRNNSFSPPPTRSPPKDTPFSHVVSSNSGTAPNCAGSEVPLLTSGYIVETEDDLQPLPHFTCTSLFEDVLPSSSPPLASLSSSPVKQRPSLQDYEMPTSPQRSVLLPSRPAPSSTVSALPSVPVDNSMFDDDKRRLAASLAHELGTEIPLAISESVPGFLPLTMDTPAELPALAPQGTMFEKTTISCDTHATAPVLPPMPDFPSSGSAQLPVMKRKRSLEEHTTGQQEHTDEASCLAHPESSATTRFSEHVREEDVASSTKRTRASPRSPTPPNPSRPTVESQRQQHKKLATPFRSPLRSKPALSSAAPTSSPLKPSTPSSSSKGKRPAVTPSSLGNAVPRDFTQRAGAQFKSPFSSAKSDGVAGSSSASPSQRRSSARLTPAVQALEAKAQVLRRALKIREDEQRAAAEPGKPTLEQLARKWREAGREIAWEIWNVVKDDAGPAVEGPSRGGWGFEDKKGSKNSWGWDNDGDGEEDAARRKAEDEEGSASSDAEEAREPTLGMMLRQLRIDPATLGWNEDAGDFVDDTST